jgi:hypothetical protein
MRAALGLAANGVDDVSYYLRQQGLQQGLGQQSLGQQGIGQQSLGQQSLQHQSLGQQSLQRHGLQQQSHQQSGHQQQDLRLRAQQLLLQEHLDRQLEEQQLRAIGEQLNDYPDLQQHYSRMLLNEQLIQQEERAYLQEQAQVQQATQQAANQRYQEELRRHQLGLRQLEEPVAQQPQSSYTAYNQQQQQQQASSVLSSQQRSPASSASIPPAIPQAHARDPPAETYVPKPAVASAKKKPPVERKIKRGLSKDSEESEPPAKRRNTGPKERKTKVKPRKSPPKQADATSSEAPIHSPSAKPRATPTSALEKVALAAFMATPQIVNRGTVEELLNAAAAEDKVDEAADILCLIKDVEWPDSEPEEEEEEEGEEEEQDDRGLRMPIEPAESIILPTFTSLLPRLPEEPLYDDYPDGKESQYAVESGEANGEKEIDKSTAITSLEPVTNGGTEIDLQPKTVSNILEYPFPIDTWWPSSTGIRRERRQAGETSDEDNFEEQSRFAVESATFRANARVIRSRLASKAEPGVLEKLPHCKIHRVRTKRKKNSTAPELVYCWQVTEIYPNEIMANCSICGTWRHAACGGHHEPYSARENTERPFIAVCENCHEEKNFVSEFPLGQKRIERQRLEQLRRGLATSAVMRHSSFSKHGGTYKWPLGSVSATHIGGHTRSVHARHDKAEKQWTDMASRLGRGYGYRPKERVRVRTKELERLLVSVEDSEVFTDRHNMLLFLMRDTAKQHPVGFEGHRVNIFDPADEIIRMEEADVHKAPEQSPTDGSTPNGGNGGNGGNDPEIKEGECENQICVRPGCCFKPRFDSLFCSDSCGISVLETDLLRTFQDASDIHPSVLRH